MSAHERWMRLALAEAEAALAAGEVPVGAVLVRAGAEVARAHNRRELDGDPTAHAELLCLRAGARALGTRRLTGCTLYVTLEPCPMCAGAMVLSGLDACYFAAPDPVMGCCESVYALPQEPGFPHRLPCVGGLLSAEARALLDAFFSAHRRPADPVKESPSP